MTTKNSTKKAIRIPSSDAHLERVVNEVESFISAHIDDDDFVYRIVLSTTEAVTNAMKHGNRFDPAKQVKINLEITNNNVEISVEDEGPGFDRKVVQNPLDEKNLLRPGGRGIFLMESMADEIRYELDGRRLHLIFNRSASAAA